MVAGCCVCSDERGWTENPLVYCDGAGCNIAVHQGTNTRYTFINIAYAIVFLIIFFHHRYSLLRNSFGAQW